MSGARRIVVGYDESDRAKDALRAACELAGPDTKLTVVHAYYLPPEVRYYEFFEDLKNAFKGTAEEALDSAKEITAGCDADVSYEAVAGRAAEVLAQEAERRSADLIVVGSRGLGPLRAALGSVTHKLLHQAACPVMVVPCPCGVDGGNGSGKATAEQTA